MYQPYRRARFSALCPALTFTLGERIQERHMAATTNTTFTRKRETLAEKAAQCTEVQRDLKKSAAESRAKAAAQPPKAGKRTVAARKW